MDILILNNKPGVVPWYNRMTNNVFAPFVFVLGTALKMFNVLTDLNYKQKGIVGKILRFYKKLQSLYLEYQRGSWEVKESFAKVFNNELRVAATDGCTYDLQLVANHIMIMISILEQKKKILENEGVSKYKDKQNYYLEYTESKQKPKKYTYSLKHDIESDDDGKTYFIPLTTDGEKIMDKIPIMEQAAYKALLDEQDPEWYNYRIATCTSKIHVDGDQCSPAAKFFNIIAAFILQYTLSTPPKT